MTEYPDSHHAALANPLPRFPELPASQRCQVCIIGAGYTGLSAALHLAELGYDVIVLEAQRVGWGASGRNGGQLGYAMTDLQPDLESRLGTQRARKFWDLSVEAVDLFHQLCRKHNIGCDFVAGNLGCGTSQADVDHLLHHAELVGAYGDDIYQQLNMDEVQHTTGSPIYRGGILARRAGHLNPLKYVLGLAQAARHAGVAIHETTPARQLNFSRPNTVQTDHGTVTADFLIVACNGYIDQLSSTLANRILPIDNYQAATEVLDEHLLATLIKDGSCVWDTSRSVHFFRLTPDKRLVMGCGIGIPGHPPRNLKRDCARHIAWVYPHLKDVAIEYIWGGTLGGTRNHLPDVGQIGETAYYAQGYTGHGVGLAPLVGKYLAAHIQGESPGYDLLSEVQHKAMIGGSLLRLPAVVGYRFMSNTMDMLFPIRRGS